MNLIQTSCYDADFAGAASGSLEAQVVEPLFIVSLQASAAVSVCLVSIWLRFRRGDSLVPYQVATGRVPPIQDLEALEAAVAGSRETGDS